jgi:hypothetical protein
MVQETSGCSGMKQVLVVHSVKELGDHELQIFVEQCSYKFEKNSNFVVKRK